MAAEYRDSIFIEAEPGLVFEYFTKPEALVRWMGDRAALDPRPGGEFTLYFDEKCVEGRYVAVEPPHRLVIAWGRRGSPSFPPSTSMLEVRLVPENGGTRVQIVHTGLPESEHERHVLGWQHYLGRLRELGSGKEPETHVTPRSLNDGAD